MDIATWYLRYGESVYRRSLRLCRNEHQARDLTQEVFLRAHRYRQSYRGDSGPMAWLFALADRCFLDSIDKPLPVYASELRELIDQENEGLAITFEKQDLIARLLTRAKGDVRSIVIHRYFDELDLETIAARLSIDERTVRRKLQLFLEQARRLADGKP